jgi:hypothetical protein
MKNLYFQVPNGYYYRCNFINVKKCRELKILRLDFCQFGGLILQLNQGLIVDKV